MELPREDMGQPQGPVGVSTVIGPYLLPGPGMYFIWFWFSKVWVYIELDSSFQAMGKVLVEESCIHHGIGITLSRYVPSPQPF
ncbi:hypothetical protein ES703_99117 [subsurface metagenome]